MTTILQIREVLAGSPLDKDQQAHFGYVLNQFDEEHQKEVLAVLTEDPSIAESLYKNLLEKAEAEIKGDRGAWEEVISSEEEALKKLV